MSASPARPWIPAGPVPPAGGFTREANGSFVVPGVAIVLAWPHRRPSDAARLCRRIAADASSYLPVLVGLGSTGVYDCRPSSHASGARRPDLAAEPLGPPRPPVRRHRHAPDDSRAWWRSDARCLAGGHWQRPRRDRTTVPLDRAAFGRFPDGPTLGKILPAPRSADPFAAAALADAADALAAELSPEDGDAVRSFLTGGNQLPRAVVGRLRARLTHARIAELLGVAAVPDGLAGEADAVRRLVRKGGDHA